MSDTTALPTTTLPTTTEPVANSAPAATPPPAEELIDIDHFAKVKLRVGAVIAAEPVPKSKKLLKLQVDLGPQLGVRQILSGIATFYPAESLIGKRIVVVANLKPARMMGEESHGMLLAGSTDDGTALAIVEPAAHLPLGATVR